MNWLKKGMFFRPSGKGDALTHGFVPTAELIDQDLLRIYFSTRDKNLVSRIRYIDVNPKNMEIIYTSPEPILNTGEFSCFDEDGVVPSSIINIGDEKYLYYFGWQKTFSNGYMLLCGLAISRDNGKTFKRFSKTPLLERSDREPFQRSTVSVLRDNNIFRMWYSSGVSWTEFNGKPCPKYLIRYAESTDGIKWNHTDKICIDFLDDDEFGIARPWVINEDGIYKCGIQSEGNQYLIDWVMLFRKWFRLGKKRSRCWHYCF